MLWHIRWTYWAVGADTSLCKGSGANLGYQTDWRKFLKLDAMDRAGLMEVEFFGLFLKCEGCKLVMTHQVFFTLTHRCVAKAICWLTWKETPNISIRIIEFKLHNCCFISSNMCSSELPSYYIAERWWQAVKFWRWYINEQKYTHDSTQA